MGFTHVWARVANPARPEKSIRLKMLVDSGAVYSVVPKKVLERLGIKPRSVRRFILADGTVIKRRMSGALFALRREEGVSPVIFGEEGDVALLGIVSLEALGLMLDPLRRQLRPLPLFLASSRHGRRRAEAATAPRRPARMPRWNLGARASGLLTSSALCENL